MIALIGFYWYGLLIALGIGFFTGWHIWRHQPVPAPIVLGLDDELIDWPKPDYAPPPSSIRPSALVAEPEVADEVSLSEEVAPDDAAGSEERGETAPALLTDVPGNETTPEQDATAADAAPAHQPPMDELGPAIAAQQDEVPDDLTMIKGIGPEIDAALRSLGVQRFEDIASWMPEDIERIDGELGVFKGRILRDEWIAQARLLARGDMESFEQRYGHLS